MPDPTLQAAALRYAAGDLTATEAATFEARLATDQDARDALAEAVRLSARALGQEPPAAHRSFLAAARERLCGWCPAWLARRAYHGHPLVWAGLGAATIAACTLFGLVLADRTPAGEPAATAVAGSPAAVVVAPVPRPAEHNAAEPDSPLAACAGEPCRSVAEIWADLSTPDHVGKVHDDELRWRDKLRGFGALHTIRAVTPAEPRVP